MPNPDKNSATALDGLVRGLDSFAHAKDIALAAEEFALGLPLYSRPLDLCFGLAAVDAQTAVNAFKPIVIGRGLIRESSDVPVVIPASGLETAFDPLSLISVNVTNAFAFGSVFITSYIQNNTHQHYLSVDLVRNDLGGGTPMLVVRDVGVNDSIEWMRQGLIGPIPFPANDDTVNKTAFSSVELMRLVLDIETLNLADSKSNRIDTHIIDLRRPRGWAGYSEETMASILTPLINQNKLDIDDQYSEAAKAVLGTVQAWVGLSDWYPSFIAYWQTSGNNLPVRLKSYLLTEMGIVI